MKINFTLWKTELCGGVRVIFEVANRLMERDHEVTIISLGKGNEHQWFPLKVSVKYVKIPFTIEKLNHDLPKLKLYFHFDYIESLSRAIPQCDISVATFFLTAFAVNRSPRGIPFYYVQHYEPVTGLRFSDPYFSRMAEETYYLPFNVITISTWLKELLEKKFGKKPYLVLNGVNTDVFYPRGKRKSKHHKLIMSFLRGYEVKGDMDILNTIRIVSKKRPDAEFILIGKRSTRLAPDLPVSLMSNLTDDELASLYSISDVFVSPSWYEGFPLPPLEAMACGTPVVTTDSLGVREYAKHEYNALIVPPRAHQKLAEGILRVLSDEQLAKKLSQRGIKTAKKLTWDKTVDNIEKIFKNAVERG